ncbi:MAG: glycosyltransferase, partial [Polyangiales bacterium]
MLVTHVMAPGPAGGAENVVLEGCAALLEQGHELTLRILIEARCPQHGKRLIEAAHNKGIPTQALWVRGRIDPRAVGALRAALREGPDEIVHAHGYKALVYGLLSRSKASSFVVTHHGETSDTRLARLYERIARALYRRVDRVFAVSHATTEALAEAGVPRSKLGTVPNPISLGAPNAHSEARGDGLHLLFLGRLSPEKGLDVLLRALASPRAP